MIREVGFRVQSHVRANGAKAENNHLLLLIVSYQIKARDYSKEYHIIIHAICVVWHYKKAFLLICLSHPKRWHTLPKGCLSDVIVIIYQAVMEMSTGGTIRSLSELSWVGKLIHHQIIPSIGDKKSLFFLPHVWLH